MDNAVYSETSGNSSEKECKTIAISNGDVSALEPPSQPKCTSPNKESGACSTWSQLKAYFVGMGFKTRLVDKVIEENGEDNVDLLLETLFTYSALEQERPDSSGSPSEAHDSNNEETNSSLGSSVNYQENEEVNGYIDSKMDKRASLSTMNFSEKEIDLAITTLGDNAPVVELVDFIIASQAAEKIPENSGNDPSHSEQRKHEEITTETLFGTMDKTLQLLEMGFSEQEISSVIDKYGTQIPIPELADSIFANQIAEQFVKEEETSEHENDQHSHIQNDLPFIKKEQSSKAHLSEREYMPWCMQDDIYSKDDFPTTKKRKFLTRRSSSGLSSVSCSYSKTAEPGTSVDFMCNMYNDLPESEEEKPKMSKNIIYSTIDHNTNIHQLAAKAPYFFYGNVVDITQETWSKLSQFLYGIEPEFANTRFFSAFIRKEGYIHNLPTNNRFHILPRPPMTIEDAIPRVKPWWPSWDTRKQLSCISSEVSGLNQLCQRLGDTLIASKGMVSPEQQINILHQCKKLNLLWVGEYKLGPIEPSDLEKILGYPLNHTQVAGCGLAERLSSLKNCFQTDTLGYHLSVLKGLFPDGLKVLSLYSGIGGAEVALHRLGIHLKCVVAVEGSEINCRVLEKWWQTTGRNGELVLFNDIQKITSHKLESLMRKFGGFDLIIGGNMTNDIIGSTKIAMNGDVELDFQLFCEFVRVVQRVRDTMGRRR